MGALMRLPVGEESLPQKDGPYPPPKHKVVGGEDTRGPLCLPFWFPAFWAKTWPGVCVCSSFSDAEPVGQGQGWGKAD